MLPSEMPLRIRRFRDPLAVQDAVRSGFGGGKVIVIGDIMLDRHIQGGVHRISPEAPVPVVQVNGLSAMAGGAGNVAANLVAMGLRVELLGVVGGDAAAEELRQALAVHGIGHGGIVVDAERPTTTKTRVVGGHQQMLRLDAESTAPVSSRIEAQLLERALVHMQAAAAVVLSDYAKGVLTPGVCAQLIRAARSQGIPVLVDPKGTLWDKYRLATRITPNRSELAAVAKGGVGDLASLLGEARRVREELELDALTVTLSEAGMLHVFPDGALQVPAMARELFDVSGAGDTAIAALAASMGAGLDDGDGLVLANVAAGLAVAKWGAVAIGRDELLGELTRGQHCRVRGGKALTVEMATKAVGEWQSRGETVVFTNGCFDILHAGHVSYLAKAREMGDRLVVGLNADASVRRLKGDTRPINPQDMRALVLGGLEAVDAVVLFEDDSPLELIRALRPQVLVKGADYRIEDVAGASDVISWGGRVELVELVAGMSTTSIAARLASS